MFWLAARVLVIITVNIARNRLKRGLVLGVMEGKAQKDRPPRERADNIICLPEVPAHDDTTENTDVRKHPQKRSRRV